MEYDDTVICSECREQVEERLGRWRYPLERREMKVGRIKTKYMWVNERQTGGKLKVDEVKY